MNRQMEPQVRYTSKGLKTRMNLPVRQLFVTDDAWAKLQRNVWSNDYVKGQLVYNQDVEQVQVRYRGGHSREYPKKSFEIKRSSGIIHMNAEYDDPSMIRNALSFYFFRSIGVPSPATQHCVLELNGQNLGVYLEIEGVDDMFFRRRKISYQSLIYAGNDDANFSLFSPDTKKLKGSLFDGYELVIGSDADKRQLETFIFDINTLESSEWVPYLNANLDVENYLRLLTGAVCTGNYDGFNQNYAIYRCARLHVYRLIPWDYEGSWGRNCFGEPCSSNSVRIIGYNTLTTKLLEVPAWMTMYRSILGEVVESSFTSDHLVPELERMMTAVRTEIARDSHRKSPIAKFEREYKYIARYLRQRRKALLAFLGQRSHVGT